MVGVNVVGVKDPYKIFVPSQESFVEDCWMTTRGVDTPLALLLLLLKFELDVKGIDFP